MLHDIVMQTFDCLKINFALFWKILLKEKAIELMIDFYDFKSFYNYSRFYL